MMTREERLKASIAGMETDRVPYSLWYHLPKVDQDPLALAQEQIDLAELYGLDFIKMMPFGNYGAQDYGLSVDFFCTETQPAFERRFGIWDPTDWGNIEPLPACYGTYGKQVQLAQYTQRLTKGKNIPFIQTIFSPFTTAKKLAGPRIFQDMLTHPHLLHSALQAITETTINFVKANIDAGVSGFFFATQCASSDYLTPEQHEVFCEPYDLQVIASYQECTWLNILHLHGEHTYFEHVANTYPCNVINWHDRWTAPTMAEARGLTNKCLAGGINEKWLETAHRHEVEGHIRESLTAGGVRGRILAPGCCIELGTPRENILEVKHVIESMFLTKSSDRAK